MAGANNKSLKAAGFKPAGIKVIRSTGGAGLSIRSAISHAQQHGVAIPAKAAEHAPTGWQKAAERSGMTGWQKAANDSREKRVAAMQAARGAPQTGWQRAAAGLKVEAGPATRKAAPPALRANAGLVRTLNMAGRAAKELRRDVAQRETPIDRTVPKGARLNNHDYAARGGRFLQKKHGLSRHETEALMLHPNSSEIQAYHHDKVKALRVNVQSPIGHGLLRDLVSGKEKLPAKYLAMAEARRKAKADAGERWAAIRKARA